MSQFQVKIVPAVEWAATPYLGRGVCLMDENTVVGFWNGESYVATGSGVSLLSDGTYGLIDPRGGEYPLTFLAGMPHEGLIAGVADQVVTLDMGSDASHSELLWTFNANGGSSAPDTVDNILASARFVLPDGNANVEKTAIDGAADGTVYSYRVLSGYMTQIHFAFRGEAAYIAAAGGTVTADEMVVMSFPYALNVSVVEIRVGTAYGTSNRYRKLTVTGYSA